MKRSDKISRDLREYRERMGLLTGAENHELASS